MSYIYAMSDIYGCLDAFEYALSLVDFSGDNKHILLGDYIHGSDDYGVLNKNMQLQNEYGAQTGRFYNDTKIVAGHIGTAEISGDPRFHDIYFDGESHYYIDGTVLESGLIPVIKIDTKNNKYYRVTETGVWLILPYDEEK